MSGRISPSLALLVCDWLLSQATRPVAPEVKPAADSARSRAAVARTQALLRKDPEHFQKLGKRGGRPRLPRT
jgi:hypothetical protein